MIEVRHLHKSYGPIRAVDDVSFAINQGEIVGFLGPNGAGKTTTMKMLTCFLAPTSGEVRVAGHDIYQDSMAVRRAVGYLPEDTPLYKSMTVLDFLRFVAAVREVPASRQKERLRAVVEVCGIKDRLGQIIGTLSKGYRQRVGLAQALVHDPPVLILDEPTSGLDPNQIAEIREVIRSLGKQKTLILSTHVLPEVEATCDRVIIIDAGKVVGDGSIEVLSKARLAQAGFLLSLETSQATERIRKALEALPDVDKVEPVSQGGAHSFIITPKKDKDPRLEIMKVCVAEGWIILQLTPKAASLEEVFRGLTQGGALARGAKGAPGSSQDEDDGDDDDDDGDDEDDEGSDEGDGDEDDEGGDDENEGGEEDGAGAGREPKESK
jgi:ABC-2 type transport system ATP-binding protein